MCKLIVTPKEGDLIKTHLEVKWSAGLTTGCKEDWEGLAADFRPVQAPLLGHLSCQAWRKPNFLCVSPNGI